jgi:hypothetical protein
MARSRRPERGKGGCGCCPRGVGVYFVLAMCLFPRPGYLGIWAKLTAALGGLGLVSPSAKALPTVEPHEEQALGHCAVEDRGLQRGQRRVVVTALVVVREPLCRSEAAKLPLGEQGHRLGIMLHERARAIQRGHHAGREAPGLHSRHGTSPGLNTSYAPSSEDWTDSAVSSPSSCGSGVVAGSSGASVGGRTGRLASTATALASSGFRS